MARLDRKKRIEDISKDLVRSTSHETTLVKELLGLLLEDAKHNLVTSTGDETIRLQGEAQAFTRLHTMVTTMPPSLKRT